LLFFSSFTDAYINELRSEIVAMYRTKERLGGDSDVMQAKSLLRTRWCRTSVR
jgi:hypothetical protein